MASFAVNPYFNLFIVLFLFGALVPDFTHASVFPYDARTIQAAIGSGSSTGTAFSAPGNDRTILSAISHCYSGSVGGILRHGGTGSSDLLLYRNGSSGQSQNQNFMVKKWDSANALSYDKANADTCFFWVTYLDYWPPVADTFTATVDTTDLEAAVATTTAAVSDLNSEFTLLWNFLQGIFVLFLVWMCYRFIEKYIIP